MGGPEAVLEAGILHFLDKEGRLELGLGMRGDGRRRLGLLRRGTLRPFHDVQMGAAWVKRLIDSPGKGGGGGERPSQRPVNVEKSAALAWPALHRPLRRARWEWALAESGLEWLVVLAGRPGAEGREGVGGEGVEALVELALVAAAATGGGLEAQHDLHRLRLERRTGRPAFSFDSLRAPFVCHCQLNLLSGM